MPIQTKKAFQLRMPPHLQAAKRALDLELPWAWQQLAAATNRTIKTRFTKNFEVKRAKILWRSHFWNIERERLQLHVAEMQSFFTCQKPFQWDWIDTGFSIICKIKGLIWAFENHFLTYATQIDAESPKHDRRAIHSQRSRGHQLPTSLHHGM